MTNNRLVAIGYVLLGLFAGLFLEHVLLLAFGASAVTQPLTRPLYNDWTWSSVIGLGVAAAVGIYLWKLPKTHDVSLEIASELKRVSWPSMAETRAASVAVIVATVISAVLLGFFDVFWQYLTDLIQNPNL